MKTLIFSILILIAAQAAAQTTEPTVEQQSTANYTIATMIANMTNGYISQQFTNDKGELRFYIVASSIFNYSLFIQRMNRIVEQYDNIEIRGAFQQVSTNPDQIFAIIIFDGIPVVVMYAKNSNIILVL